MNRKLQKVLLAVTGIFTVLFIYVNPFFDKPLADIVLEKVKLSSYQDTLPRSGKSTGVKSRHPSLFKAENPINSGSIISSNFDFIVNPITSGKFYLSFYNPYQKDISIKVYDIIGNLVLEEKVNMQGKFQKEYDLSDYKTKLFIIEVGNSNYRLTKRVST